MERILLPVDFSACSLAAAHLGLAIAREHRAAVTLFHASGMLEHARVPREVLDEQRRVRGERHTAELRQLATELGAASPHVAGIEMVVRHSDPAFGIANYAEEWKADLIVMGSHGPDERSFMLGSVSSQTAREAHCPVLITREAHRPRFPEGGRFHRPVVAIDYSKFSAPAARWAADLAEPEATIELVHVYYAPDFEVTPELEAALGEARAEELEALAELAQRVDIAPVRVAERAEIGRVADQLTELVSGGKTDLVVIGAHGKDQEHARLGSVADRMLRASAAPVLILTDLSVR